MLSFLCGAAACFLALLWYGKYLAQLREQERLRRWRGPVWIRHQFFVVRRK